MDTATGDQDRNALSEQLEQMKKNLFWLGVAVGGSRLAWPKL